MDKTFQCGFCGIKYGTQGGLWKHRKKQHEKQMNSLQIVKYSNFICYNSEECPGQGFRLLIDYLKHLETKHQDCGVTRQQLSFNSKQEFFDWKETIESETISQFIRHGSSTLSKRTNVNQTTFYCNRNGKYRPSGRGYRKLQFQTTRKTTLSCPASIFLLENETSGSCDVIYYSGHLGHELQVEHLNLTEKNRLQIVTLLKQCNYNKAQVLNILKYNTKQEYNRRMQSVDKLDLKNIMKQFNLYEDEQFVRIQELKKEEAHNKEQDKKFKRYTKEIFEELYNEISSSSDDETIDQQQKMLILDSTN